MWHDGSQVNKKECNKTVRWMKWMQIVVVLVRRISASKVWDPIRSMGNFPLDRDKLCAPLGAHFVDFPMFTKHWNFGFAFFHDQCTASLTHKQSVSCVPKWTVLAFYWYIPLANTWAYRIISEPLGSLIATLPAPFLFFHVRIHSLCTPLEWLIWRAPIPK